MIKETIQLHLFFLSALLVLLIANQKVSAQSGNVFLYQYISPVPNSSMNLPESNIIIREGEIIRQSSLDANKFLIVGTSSGTHSFDLIISDDSKTIILKPLIEFTQNEMVNVYYKGGIFNINNKELKPFELKFVISSKDPAKDYSRTYEEILGIEGKKSNIRKSLNDDSSIENINNGFPPDYPTVTINTSNNPSPGYLFIAPFFYPFIPVGYMMILDNDGVPIYYQRGQSIKADWKVQPNGFVTYFDLTQSKFYEMDSSYTIVDSFYTGNGYTTDIHELQILPDGHALLMAYDPEYVRMDTVVAGGDSNAVVIGLIIQEIDVDNNVVFQWRSWDHFQITDATEDIDLTASYIDYVHGNAIDVDSDNNLLISCRHMDEITKINRQTGDIIWRWGGIKSRNNQFLFINDNITFSHQHNIRKLANGNLTLFDNGNLHSPSFSRGSEYQLDEVNKIAILVWDYSIDPQTFSFAMGNTQRLDNHNTIIGWGWSTNNLRAISEVKVDGTETLELSLPDSNLSYRAYRFPWKSNFFVTNPDSIFFESVPVGDSSIITVDLVNNSSNEISITGFYNKDSSYSVTNPLPFVLPPSGTVAIDIKFKPYKDGYFKDYLHIRSDTDTSRVAQVMLLKGRTDTTYSGVGVNYIVDKYSLQQNYPNPFNPVTNIDFNLAEKSFVSLIVYDVLGNKVNTLVENELHSGRHSVKFNAADLSSGVYFYRLQAGQFYDVKKLVVLK